MSFSFSNTHERVVNQSGIHEMNVRSVTLAVSWESLQDSNVNSVLNVL